MLPITLGMALLNYAGVIGWISGFVSPLFGVMGLDGAGAMVFISAAFGNLYSGIGVMATLGVDFRAALILASMCLICHNMIIETAIQRKTGASAVGIILLRVSMALVAGVAMNLVLPERLEGKLFFSGVQETADTLWGLVAGWALTMLPLIVKILAIIISLNVIQACMREFGLLKIIAVPLRPLMRVFGLPLSTSFLWIICNVVGLTYGGAVLVEEVRRGEASPRDASLLNTHVAISHSLLEDTLLFISIGLPALGLMLPRLVLAIVAVWTQRLATERKVGFRRV